MTKGKVALNDILYGEQLAALIRQAFPLLQFDERRLDRSGGDHDLLIVDESIAFRFPRPGIHSLAFEIRVLDHLRRRSTVAVPTYIHVEPEGRFAGYRLLNGSASTPAGFAALSADRQDDILRAAALFLSQLHGLSPGSIAPARDWPSTWTPLQFAERAITQFVPALATALPRQARAVEAFYTRYRELSAPSLVIVHGDFVAEHVLLDQETRQISGIIDFGDVALGDPAQDFLGFWAFGPRAALRALELYEGVCADPDLLDRSGYHFVRYCLDSLFINLDDGLLLEPSGLATRIDELLAFTSRHLGKFLSYAGSAICGDKGPPSAGGHPPMVEGDGSGNAGRDGPS